jgi:hypothetical protein
MDNTVVDGLTILAIFCGPIAAVQATFYIERRRQADDRRRGIFRTLMSTRANITSIEHVQSLNAIDIEFADSGKKGEAILSAWRTYRDHLNTPAAASGWADKRADLLTDLLHNMALFFNYKFDDVYIKRSVYIPELENIEIRKDLLKFLKGDVAIPVRNAAIDEFHLSTAHTRRPVEERQ